MTFLTIHNLAKSFHGTPVLNEVTLEVGRGEVLSLIGPSGSGKSTLLRCIAQLEEPDRGFTMLDGELLGLVLHKGHLHHAPRRLVQQQRAEVGMVFQHFELFPHLTVLENIVEAPVRVRGLSRDEAEQRARELLARVGLAAKDAAYPNQLSGGQKQRVAIARALAMRPKVLLFDEPTSALDPELVGEVLDVIKDLAGTGMTLVVAIHEIGFARDVADTVAFLANGSVVEHGPARDVIDRPSHTRTQEFLRRIALAP